MVVRCKMICIEKADRVSAYQKNSTKSTHVKFCAVSSLENKTWAQYIPSGNIDLQIDNPAAVDQFVLGETYFVDFQVAPAAEAAESTKAAGA